MNNVVFISMNEFGYTCLERLLHHQKKVDLVITLQKKSATAISDFRDFGPLAHKHKKALIRIRHINEAVSALKTKLPTVVFVLGWSQIIPPEILAATRFGCIGAHPSLLPRNRGRAIIPWHFINKEPYGGITLFYLDKGIDSGPIIVQRRFRITKEDNASSYYKKITDLANHELLFRYDTLISKRVPAKKQNEAKATYLPKRNPEDSLINFTLCSYDLHNHVRAVASIYPLAHFFYQGHKIYTSQSRPLSIKPNSYPNVCGLQSGYKYAEAFELIRSYEI